MESVVSLKNISVSFDGEQVLKDISLDIKDGEFVTFLGPSGCGKTTTLRIIGGFVQPDAGEVFFRGAIINDLPPHLRQVNTIFQRYALFPHLNVFENVAFGMRIQKKPKKEVKENVERLLELVNLTGFENRKADSLSGGQQQRVAIARALAADPRVLLLDEPLGALDLKLRKDMQVELKKMQQQLGITFIFVTHDQEEALSMSDTVVVMDKGVIQQVGTPEDIYNEPANAFVADFIGESNIVDGYMRSNYVVMINNCAFDCVDCGFAPMEPVDVVIRPEDIEVCNPAAGHLTGEVANVTFKGVHYEIIVDVDGFMWMIQSTVCRKPGDIIGLYVDPEAIHIMRKSEYSGAFGDYSSFSDELEELSNPELEEEEEVSE